MKFTQPCFIRKNTPELRKRLEELGYLPPSEIWYDENFAICTILRDNVGEYIVFKIDDDFERIIVPSYPYIDCGDNEELFLALAGLRDDNDVNQLFYYEGKLVVCVQDFSSTLNIYNDKFYKVKLFDNKNILFEVPFKKLRKCTVEEIIERFKK